MMPADGDGRSDRREPEIDELCFRARALAQTHPMTEVAHRYRQQCLETERVRQPVPELADWAATALLVGYCLRRAEEHAVGAEWTPSTRIDGTVLADEAIAMATVLRLGDAGGVTLLPMSTSVAALDTLIDGELGKRREHVREQLDDESWAELEDYISWWTVHGYAVRAVETRSP